MSTVAEAVSQIKLDNETVKPGSVPCGLADVIVALEQELKKLTIDKNADEKAINNELD